MFIVTSAYLMMSLPLGETSGRRTLARKSRLRSYGALKRKKDRQAINISPLWGEAIGLVHLEVEFAEVKSGCERTNPRLGCMLFTVCCLLQEDQSSQSVRRLPHSWPPLCHRAAVPRARQLRAPTRHHRPRDRALHPRDRTDERFH